MLRQQGRDLLDSLLDAVGKAAGAEGDLDLVADGLPRRVADTGMNAAIGRASAAALMRGCDRQRHNRTQSNAIAPGLLNHL